MDVSKENNSIINSKADEIIKVTKDLVVFLKKAACFYILFLFSFMSTASARGLYRSYESMVVPGAYCGNGQPYRVFFDKKGASKWAFEFRPGGACWDKDSCFGAIPHAFPLFSPKRLLLRSIFSKRKLSRNFLANHSQVIFPYCTADVYAGTHLAIYDDKELYHYGRTNVEKSIALLIDKGVLDWSKVKDLFVYGSSAGAFGTLVHLPYFDEVIPEDAKDVKRTLIVDSAGLHFGATFWSKFTPEFREDFKDAFSRHGLKGGLDNGNLARFMPSVCYRYSHWNVGVIQGSQDIIMSRFFGNISPSDHEGLVFSDEGLYQATLNSNNCSSWISKSIYHAYLYFSPFRWKKIDGVGPYKFSKRVYRGRTKRNFVSKSLKKAFDLN